MGPAGGRQQPVDKLAAAASQPRPGPRARLAQALHGRGPLPAAVDAGLRVMASAPLHGGERPGMVGQELADLAEGAARDQMSYRAFLAELLMTECDDGARQRSERRIKAASFPRDKSPQLSGVAVKEPCKVAVQEAADASERQLRFTLCPVGGEALSCWSGASVGSRHDCRFPAHPRVVPAPPSD